MKNEKSMIKKKCCWEKLPTLIGLVDLFSLRFWNFTFCCLYIIEGKVFFSRFRSLSVVAWERLQVNFYKGTKTEIIANKYG